MSERSKTEKYVDHTLKALFNDLCIDGHKLRKPKDWINKVSLILKKVLPTYNFIIHHGEVDLKGAEFEDIILNWYFPIGRKSYKVVIFKSGTISDFAKPKKNEYFTDGGPEKAEVYKHDDTNKDDGHLFHLFRCSTVQGPRFQLQYKGLVFNKEEIMLRASESLNELSEKK